MDTCRDIMSTDIVTVLPEDNLYEAATKMKDANIGAIPVTEGDKLIGMLTDRDIVIRGVAERKPNSTEVNDIMSDRKLVWGSPDMTVDEAAKIMADAQVRRLPILENEQIVGMLSIGDLAVKSPYKDEASWAMSEISETHNPNVSNDLQ